MKSNEAIVFYANQGNVQEVIFIKYDSLEVEHLKISLPIDTVLDNIKYNGKIVLDMIKTQ